MAEYLPIKMTQDEGESIESQPGDRIQSMKWNQLTSGAAGPL